MLLALLVDAAGRVKHALDRPQHGREKGALAVEYARHVAAEHGRERDDDRAIKHYLSPTDDGHGRKPLCARQNRSGVSSA